MLLTGVLVVHGIFLLPSYLAATSEVNIETTELSAASAAVATSTTDAAAELATLKSDAAYLSKLATAPSASAALRAVLAVPHPGITIQSLTYTPPKSDSPASATVVITGTADTREHLRAYDLVLSGLSFIANVDLPISDYAQQTNIPFTLTLTGTLTP